MMTQARRARVLTFLLACGLCASLLAACGQRGDLVLPDNTDQAQASDDIAGAEPRTTAQP